MGLKSVLQGVRDRSLDAGGVISDRVVKKLSAYRRRQFTIFVTLEVLLIVAVVFCVYYVITHPKNTTEVKVIAGLIGIGAGGGVEIIRRIWKEWSQADLMIILIENATEAQVTSMIDRLLGSL